MSEKYTIRAAVNVNILHISFNSAHIIDYRIRTI